MMCAVCDKVRFEKMPKNSAARQYEISGQVQVIQLEQTLRR